MEPGLKHYYIFFSVHFFKDGGIRNESYIHCKNSSFP